MSCTEREWQDTVELATRCGVTATRLSAPMIDPELVASMPLDVLTQHCMLPLKREGFELTLAMADPLDVIGEDTVRFITGCRILRVAAAAAEIMDALEGREAEPASVIDGILEQIPDFERLTYDADEENEHGEVELAPSGPIIQLVNSIVRDAIRMGVSDIHVEPQKASLRVRFRVDGNLRTMVELPKRVQSAVLSRLKIASGMDISESRKPQDGRTRAHLEGRDIDMRVSSLPTFHGEKIVMRLLDPKAVVVNLDQLGLNPTDRGHLDQVLACSQGLILCTGPTGSGKTSTLYSSLLHLHEETDNLVTVEDPVEYQLAGINQVQIHARAGLTFAGALRSILRQDPDVVLIGEVRDLETAEIAVQAAQTGHLVLSSLHTNDALSTVGRLVLMGVAPFLLASSLLCVIAQRLVRRLCPHCRAVGSISEAHRAILRLAGVVEPPETGYHAVGCAKCDQVGYKGRLGLFEFLMISEPIRALLLAQASEAELERVARQEGMTSLLEDGLGKCLDGQTSLDEVLRVVTVRRVGGRTCTGCQAAVPAEHHHCVYCGTQLSKLCGGCRRPLKMSWKACPDCGCAA